MSSFPYVSRNGSVLSAWEFPTPRCSNGPAKLNSPTPSSSSPVSKRWLNRQVSSEVSTTMLCFTGFVFPYFLTIGDHFNLQRTSKAAKQIIDVYRFRTYALPFKKDIEALETAYITEQYRSQSREALVRRFFTTPEILLLDPVPLTALFDSLHPETLKFQIYWEHQSTHLIKKIAVHFFLLGLQLLQLKKEQNFMETGPKINGMQLIRPLTIFL